MRFTIGMNQCESVKLRDLAIQLHHDAHVELLPHLGVFGGVFMLCVGVPGLGALTWNSFVLRFRQGPGAQGTPGIEDADFRDSDSWTQ